MGTLVLFSKYSTPDKWLTFKVSFKASLYGWEEERGDHCTVYYGANKYKKKHSLGFWRMKRLKVLGLLVEQKVISFLCDLQPSMANIFLCYCALTLCLVF